MQETAVHLVQPIIQTGLMAHPVNKITGSMAEKIHTDNEQDRVDNARYQYPFPQFMFFDKPVGLEISLNSYDHFFQQIRRF